MTRVVAMFPPHSDPITLAEGRPGRPPTWRTRLLLALRKHPGGATVKQLADMLDARPSRVRSALRELAASDLIEPVAWRARGPDTK